MIDFVRKLSSRAKDTERDKEKEMLEDIHSGNGAKMRLTSGIEYGGCFTFFRELDPLHFVHMIYNMHIVRITLVAWIFFF